MQDSFRHYALCTRHFFSGLQCIWVTEKRGYGTRCMVPAGLADLRIVCSRVSRFIALHSHALFWSRGLRLLHGSRSCIQGCQRVLEPERPRPRLRRTELNEARIGIVSEQDFCAQKRVFQPRFLHAASSRTRPRMCTVGHRSAAIETVRRRGPIRSSAELASG